MTDVTQSESRNGLALAALIVGIAGVLLSPVVVGGVIGLVGLVLGVVALRNPGRRGLAIGGIVTGAIAVPVALVALMMIAILVPALGRAREKAREVVVASDLHQIGFAVSMYCADWDGAMPQHLAYVTSNLRDVPRVLKDPRGGTPPWTPTPGADLATQMAEIDAHGDYIYAGAGLGRMQRIRNASQVIVLYDKGIFGKTRVIGFADGHVENFPSGSPQLQQAVERNNAAREAMGAPALPLDLMGPPGAR